MLVQFIQNKLTGKILKTEQDYFQYYHDVIKKNCPLNELEIIKQSLRDKLNPIYDKPFLRNEENFDNLKSFFKIKYDIDLCKKNFNILMFNNHALLNLLVDNTISMQQYYTIIAELMPFVEFKNRHYGFICDGNNFITQHRPDSLMRLLNLHSKNKLIAQLYTYNKKVRL